MPEITRRTLLAFTAVASVAEPTFAEGEGTDGADSRSAAILKRFPASAELRDGIIKPEMLGALGDGFTDDGPALTGAISFASLTGIKVEGTPGKTYRIATSVSITRAANSMPLVIDLNGSKLYCDEAGLAIDGLGAPFLESSFSVEPARGDTHLTLVSTAGIEKGDLIEILSPALTQGSIGTYHYYVASDVDGNDVWVEGTVVADITTQQIADSGQSGAIEVNVYKLARPLTIQNGEVEANDPDGLRTSIICSGHSNILADNLIFSGHTRNQIYIIYGAYSNVRDCTFRDPGYVTKDTGYANLPEHPDSLGFGYGVIFSRCYQSFVTNCRGGKGWHMGDVARGAMHVTFDNCFLMRNSYGLSCHEGAWYFNVINCSFDGGSGITGGRCAYLLAQGNTFRNLRGNAITYTGAAGNTEVRLYDNGFDTGHISGSASTVYRDGLGVALAGAMSVGRERVFEMVGNTHVGFDRVSAGFGGAGRLLVKNNAFAEGANLYDIQAMMETHIEGNNFGYIADQKAITISVAAADAGALIIVKDNTQDGVFETVANSALLYINGSGEPVLSLYNNVVNAQYLVRFETANVDIDNCVGNINKGGALFVGVSSNSIANCLNNFYASATIQVGGIVITSAAGNFSSVVGLMQTIATDAAFTLTPFSSPIETLHSGTLTGDRIVTLSTTGAIAGQRFKITRSGAGAFNLLVGTGPLKALATGTWAEFVYNGASWYLAAYGTL